MLKWTLIIAQSWIILALTTFAYAANGSLLITSIVQRADGIFFGINQNGKSSVVSAPQAQAVLERTCPNVKIAPGVFQ